MIPINTLAEPLRYQLDVLHLYLDLPGVPLRVSASDQQQARLWFERGIPLEVVETALLLGSLRRLMRPPEAPRLAAIRSLAYFQPVVEELLETPVSDSYRMFLQLKMRPYRRTSADAT
jgi:hypothetical protein